MTASLRAFYDLAVAPASYDFIVFLELADIHRRRLELDELEIIIVPGPEYGFRKDGLHSPIEERSMVLRNVLLRAPHLLPACTGVSWAKSRNSANLLFSANDCNVFPPSYTLQNPYCQYVGNGLNAMHLLGYRPTKLTAPAEFQVWAQDFLAQCGPSNHHVTINLRENPDFPSRNSNLPAWASFCHHILNLGFQPIIIKESADCFKTDELFSSFPHAPQAAMDVLFRTALYENSYVNLFVNNGPASTALYSYSNCAVFKMITGNNVSTSNEWFQQVLGLGAEGQQPFLSHRQRFIWQDDDYENILLAFTDLHSFLTAQSENQDLYYEINDHKHLESYVASILLYLSQRCKHHISAEEIDILQRIAFIQPDFSARDFFINIYGARFDEMRGRVNDLATELGSNFHV